MNVKKFSDDDLYEFLYQSNVDEELIPKKRKNKITLCRKNIGFFRFSIDTV